MTFPSSLLSVRRARRFVRDAVASYLPPAELDTVELLTSEVVTNAVVHAGSSPIVEVATDGGTVRVSVEDRDPGWPMPHSVPEDATSGRGLALVDTMAHAWGVERAGGRGKRIWFEVRGRR
ncbi:MAG: ATP-binding protein [Acidimicrobiales bacterium]